MRISMIITFSLFEKVGNKLYVLTKEAVNGLSIGGYCFNIDGKDVYFDWDSFSGTEKDGIFRLQTGNGGLIKDYELSDCYDEMYEKMGLSRNQITAKFLASVKEIKEIHINFIDINDDECNFGCNDQDEHFLMEIKEICFVDMDATIGGIYSVSQEVINNFNNKLKEDN